MRRRGDCIMFLRVVCQVCGKVGVIDTEKPIGRFPRWECYRLRDLGINAGAYSHYDIWICDECLRSVSTYLGLYRDELGECYEDWEIDWEKLIEMVENSLKISLKVQRGGD